MEASKLREILKPIIQQLVQEEVEKAIKLYEQKSAGKKMLALQMKNC
jgi:Ca2+-binding EF-hand superfamily protein